jgi:dTDP-4-dehydrorhamnose 3,5-epimerase
MPTEPLAIRGAVLLRPPQVQADERGSFRRVVDVAELAALGLDPAIDQVSVATNRLRGTVRGMHYQVPPHTESKTLWCTAGSVFDVLVDLRPDEATYGSWVGVTLSGDEPCALHVPPGVAHGYQTLVDGADLTYLISAAYHRDSARSLSWADPTVGIDWPLPVTVISDRDREAPPWPPSP